MIRTFFVALLVIVFLILSTPLMAFEWLYHKSNPAKSDLQSLRLIQAVFRLILFLSGIKVVVEGKENIPQKAVLYVANHSGFFDIIASYPQCPSPTGYVAKNSILKVPFLRVWMKRLHCLFLNRDDIREGLKTILEGIDLVNKGISICIFPEGTRNHSSTLLPFKEGSLKIAEKSSCPIIPVAISGSRACFEEHLPRIKPGTITIQYGTPIIVKELSKEEKKFLGAYTQEKIQSMLDSRKLQSPLKK
ncbi:MAG: lysophospholipid acyltransferase family protein [Lachnospiraceae bacterium]